MMNRDSLNRFSLRWRLFSFGRWVLFWIGLVSGSSECHGWSDPTAGAVRQEMAERRTAVQEAARAVAQDLLPARDETWRSVVVERWESEIRTLLERDQTESYPEEAVLFVGSSSIRLWESIAEDIAPLVPIRRGFGGARSSDLAVFAPRLLAPHRYSALVIFVANDIPGEDDKVDYLPDQVLEWTAEVVNFSRQHQPDAAILIVEITPTVRRWHVWEHQRALNHRWRDYALTQPQVYFLPTAEYFMDAHGRVKSELFVEDQLHLNREGYRVWGSLIRRRLLELLP